MFSGQTIDNQRLDYAQVTGKVRFFHVSYEQGDEKRIRSIVARAVKEIMR